MNLEPLCPYTLNKARTEGCGCEKRRPKVVTLARHCVCSQAPMTLYGAPVAIVMLTVYWVGIVGTYGSGFYLGSSIKHASMCKRISDKMPVIKDGCICKRISEKTYYCELKNVTRQTYLENH